MEWFELNWWKYLLKKRSKYYQVNILKTLICRIKGHSCGVVWFNSSGLEPDMHCKNCGDNLG